MSSESSRSEEFDRRTCRRNIATVEGNRGWSSGAQQVAKDPQQGRDSNTATTTVYCDPAVRNEYLARVTTTQDATDLSSGNRRRELSPNSEIFVERKAGLLKWAPSG